MRLSYLKRPVVICLVLYCLALYLLKLCGFFNRIPENDISRLVPISAEQTRAPPSTAIPVGVFIPPPTGRGVGAGAPDSPTPQGANVALVGKVASFPHERYGRKEFILKARLPGDSSTRGRVHVRAAICDIQIGDTIALDGRLSLPPPTRVTGNFSWKKYLASHRIYCSLVSSGAPRIVKRPFFSIFRWTGSIRNMILSSFSTALPREEAGILSGIVLGEKRSLPKGLMQAFRDSGTIHLLVASGSNVTFVMVFVCALGRTFRLSRFWAVFLGAASSGIYTIAAGFDPPLLRAFAMTLAGIIGFYMDRDSGIFQALVLAAWAILLWDPASLFQPAFQMSFAACLGLLVGISRWPIPSHWPKALRFLAVIFLVSLSAQVALLPILSSYFHRVSLVSPLSNLLCVPFSGILMAGGFTLYFASIIPFSLPLQIVSAILTGLLSFFKMSVVFFAGLPNSAIWTPSPTPGLWLIYCLAVAGILAAPHLLWLKRWLVAGLAMGAIFLVFSFARPGRHEITFMSDRSPFTTALIKTPRGKVILVNAGPPAKNLAHAVLHEGTRKISAVILTSLDKPYWESLTELEKILKIERVFSPVGISPQPGYAELKESIGPRWKNFWPGETFPVERLRFTPHSGKGFSGWPEHDKSGVTITGPVARAAPAVRRAHGTWGASGAAPAVRRAHGTWSASGAAPEFTVEIEREEGINIFNRKSVIAKRPGADFPLHGQAPLRVVIRRKGPRFGRAE